MSDSPGVTCTYLGSLTDPDAYWPEPSLANRCYALGSPTSIDPAEQGYLCLGGDYASCPRWQATRIAQGYGGEQVPRRKKPMSQTALRRVIVGGTVLMAILLACAAALVFYQVKEVGEAMLQEPLRPTEVTPQTLTPAVIATPVATNTPQPSATATPEPTATDTFTPALDTFTPAPTMTLTDIPLPTASFTPLPPPPPPPTRGPTFTPQPPPTPRPAPTRAPTYTRRPTNTRPPTSTRAATLTFTPTRSPTPIRYEVQLTASAKTSNVSAGQTTNFVATLRNAGTGTDTIELIISTAIMDGWSARLYVDGADRGQGPVAVSLPTNGTKSITVQIVTSAGASGGDVGEVYLSASSKLSPTATASISFAVSIKE